MDSETFDIFTDSFFDVLDKNGNECITFRALLKAMFPMASKKELDVMEQWVSD